MKVDVFECKFDDNESVGMGKITVTHSLTSHFFRSVTQARYLLEIKVKSYLPRMLLIHNDKLFLINFVFRRYGVFS
jgi:hypothetical protein